MEGGTPDHSHHSAANRVLDSLGRFCRVSAAGDVDLLRQSQAMPYYAESGARRFPCHARTVRLPARVSTRKRVRWKLPTAFSTWLWSSQGVGAPIGHGACL